VLRCPHCGQCGNRDALATINQSIVFLTLIMGDPRLPQYCFAPNDPRLTGGKRRTMALLRADVAYAQTLRVASRDCERAGRIADAAAESADELASAAAAAAVAASERSRRGRGFDYRGRAAAATAAAEEEAYAAAVAEANRAEALARAAALGLADTSTASAIELAAAAQALARARIQERAAKKPAAKKPAAKKAAAAAAAAAPHADARAPAAAAAATPGADAAVGRATVATRRPREEAPDADVAQPPRNGAQGAPRRRQQSTHDAAPARCSSAARVTHEPRGGHCSSG
jgi:hypothetical protein